MYHALFFTFFLTFTQLHSKPNPKTTTKYSTFNPQCNETCGLFRVSFPFYIKDTSCGFSSAPYNDSFQLTCLNSTSLFLIIDTEPYKVLHFFSDGILLDFPGFSPICRPYNDLNSFRFPNWNSRNRVFGVSVDNVVGLYDCEDSSLCKANCEANNLPGCDRNKGNGNGNGNGPACCYPLSDHSVWNIGDGFDVFSKYECRGFSSWVVPRGMRSGKRGVKLEWAIPVTNNSSNEICDVNARGVNATAVEGGIRCVCDDGFVGDGYVLGSGCLKSCFKNGKEEYGNDCESNRHRKRKLIIILAVTLSTVAAILLLTLLLCLLQKRSVKTDEKNPFHFHSTLSFRKSCNTRLFTLTELDEATNGFNNTHNKLMDAFEGGVFKGTLKDDSRIAVQKVECQNEHDLIQVLTRIQLLSSIQHQELSHILGCCIDSGYIPLVVYEFPENGTLDENLHIEKDEKIRLDWFKRLSIAAQTATLLAFLQHEVSPSVFHHNLKTNCIFLDEECNVKLACFTMLPNMYRSDVYDFGLVLLEIISGKNYSESPTIALQKIRDGKLEEMVDAVLYYHEQPSFRKEQMEIVAEIATRCLIFGGDGKLRMVDVARELVHVMKDSIDCGSKRGPALEETFSNSSLLQMISMSPDSIYLPTKV